MLELFKNTLKSFKKNKLSIIGLTFLTFTATAAFTTLNSVVSSVNNKYNSLTTSGQLHDFTVSELYDTGIPDYVNNKESWNDQSKTYLFDNSLLVKSNDNQLFPYIKATVLQNENAKKYQFEYHYLLDVDKLDEITSIKKFYLTCKSDQKLWAKYQSYFEPTFLINIIPDTSTAATEMQEVYDYCTNVQKQYGKDSSETVNLSANEINNIINKVNYGLISKEIGSKSKQLIQVVTEQSTLLNDYLLRYQKENVDFRYFSSVNIGSTVDEKTQELNYFKAVLSNPTDTIDKMCIVPVDNNDKQWGNFSIYDCTYGVLNRAVDDNYSINDTVKTLPDSIGDEVNIHYVEKIFLLSKGSHGSTPLPTPINDALKALVEKDGKLLPVPNKTKEECQQWWTENKTKLEKLLKVEKDDYKEEVYLKDSKATIQWFGGAGDPSAWQITNWSSYFTTVGAQFMKANNKHTINDAAYVNETSYKEYVKNNPHITNDKDKFLGWLNTLTYPEIDAWFEKVVNDSNFYDFVVRPGGSTPYIITSSGLTPDYIYPIVSLEKFTPDSNKECILFANSAGYARIYDAYRSSETENFIVGKFKTNNKIKQQQIIDEINQFATNNMVYPKGTKAAYFADDTTNLLNTSSYRIAYIPKFIKGINSVTLVLTIFIAILTFVISAITIHRYIINNQTTLGIMRANGYSKFVIATSLVPFALITSVIGGIVGIICGVMLEVPTMSLLKNYWTLPTPAIGFSWLSLFITIFATFTLLMAVVYLTAFVILKTNTVDLMKTNSQDSPSILAKSMKTLSVKAGVITKFRISIAFSSFWKLIVLVITTSLSLSSLVFAMSTHGKFETSINATNQSKKYKYAISLFTPTTAGGQYIPTAYNSDENNNFLGIGISGFKQVGNDPRDNDYTQSSYYGLPFSWSGKAMSQYSLTFSVPGLDYGNLLPRINEYGWENNGLNQYINKPYYYSSWALAAQQNKESSTQDVINAFWTNQKIGNDSNNMLSNLFVPYAGDTLGQSLDLFYLKDRTMTKSSLDYNVGVGSAIRANPWDISISLMPDNQKNLCDIKTQSTIDFVGNALYYVEGKSNIKYKELHDVLAVDENYEMYKTFIPALDPSASDSSYNININKAMYEKMSVSLKPQFIKLLKIIYTYQHSAQNDFSILYNHVALNKNDETYTWVDAYVDRDNTNVKITGIKATKGYETKYIKLVDNKCKNLIPSISYSYNDFKQGKSFPIVVNAYAQHKYGLSIGDKIDFTFTNSANRIDHQIKVDNNLPDPDYNNHVSFTVAGICDTYEGQEYYIDQDVANYILGLKSHLLDQEVALQQTNQPNSYYPFMYDVIGTNTMMQIDFQSQGLNTKASLLNLKNYVSPANSQGQNYNITPYGFNGIFTESDEGGPALAKSMALYSSSGLYPANDKITSTSSRSVLRFGSNTQLACKIAYNQQTELGKNINKAYLAFINASQADKEKTHNELIKYGNELIEKIRYYYGDTAYTGLTSSVVDFESNKTVFQNMSDTIHGITFAILVVTLVMVIIIVVLITNMIINDSKRLASLLKAIGYSDRENAISFLSIYVPVILIGLLLSILLSWGIVLVYNNIVFNGIGIWLNSRIHWWYYATGTLFIIAIFSLSAIGAIYSIKKNRLTDAIK